MRRRVFLAGAGATLAAFTSRHSAHALGDPAVVNVKLYGARCNGIDDDSGAILNAWNALSSSGGVLYIPGQCGLGNGIDLAGKSNITVVTAGPNAGLKALALSSLEAGTYHKTLVKFTGNTKLKFQGTMTVDAGGFAHNGVGSVNNQRSIFEGLDCFNAGNVSAFFAIGGRHNRYYDCDAHNTLTDARGFWFGGLNDEEIERDVVARGLEAYNCGHTGIVWSPAGGLLSQCIAHNNAVAGMKATLRKTNGILGATVSECDFYANAQGLQVDAYNDAGIRGSILTVNANRFHSNTNHGLLAVNASDAIITGNQAYDNAYNGFAFEGGRNLTFFGNAGYDTREGSARTQQRGANFVNSDVNMIGILAAINHLYNNTVRDLSLENAGAFQVNDWGLVGNMTRESANGLFVADTQQGMVNSGAILGNFSRSNSSNFRNDPPDTTLAANRFD